MTLLNVAIKRVGKKKEKRFLWCLYMISETAKAIALIIQYIYTIINIYVVVLVQTDHYVFEITLAL